MSKTPIMVLLLVAVALGLVALALILQPGGAGGATYAGAGETLLEIEPGDVTAIRVERPDSPSVETLVRTAPGTWELTLTQEGEPVTSSWPVLAARVRPLLQTLSGLKAVAQPEEVGGVTSSGDMTVTLKRGEEPAVVFSLGADALGGAVPMRVEGGPTAFVGAEIANVFRSPGARGWRVESALPGVGVDASRIMIESPGDGVTLRRVGRRWSVEPSGVSQSARASEDAVDRLLESLAALRIERFLDEQAIVAPASEYGLDRPTLSIRAEQDERRITGEGETDVATSVTSLDVGRASDLSQSRRYASPDDGRTVFEIDAAALGGVVPVARFYFDPNATDAAAEDVGAIVIERLADGDTVYRRETTGWEVAQGVTSGDPNARAGEVIRFLRRAEADGVGFERPQGTGRTGRITLLGFSGEPLERFAFFADDGGRLIIHSMDEGVGGGVYRIYDAGLDTLGPALAPPAG
jgi:hypothetical protein